ncbi:uncharacterized protein EV420DRAFT_1479410 [Desarmillaria tabescens]|uniref:Uncharacterized protein n=1 Tax=Armillaria tabescens TaxID=1929756 RepID=A0AA39KF26_ARMTA|nr:uncharacterized protein EV420DRAFT_1479410 [Desarmillaria tabescens]KAK0458711.1 hypothetical protein EV420DRAFT_1479410 [Desarmillaria tabescens]
MPGLLQFITETQEVDYSSTGALAEEVRLWLPSCIPGGSQEPGSIRHILRLKMRMVEYKNKNVRDPDRLHKGTGRRGTNEDSWEPGLVPELPEPGIDLYQDSREKRDGTGQTWRTLSWIWTMTKINLVDGADENDDEVLHFGMVFAVVQEHIGHNLEVLGMARGSGGCNGGMRTMDEWRMRRVPNCIPAMTDDASSDGDRDEQNIGIWSDEEEVELDEEDYADL